MRYVPVAGFLLSSVLLAQEPPPPRPVNERVVRGELGLDFTSAYFFRGILQEDQGIIAQPWIELGFGLYEGDGPLRALDLTFGLWNSLHEGPTGSGGNRSMWYESDFDVGVEGRIGDRIHVGTTYTAFHSPNGSFPTVQELAFSARYDDHDQMATVLTSGLQPSALLAFELDGQRDGGTEKGIYLQLGVEPTFPLGDHLTLSAPVRVGLSLGDYYERPVFGDNDDFLGFLDFGAEIAAMLPFLPARMGPWEAKAGVHLLVLGDNNEARNNDDPGEVIFTLGMRTTF
jgi:hypothetical protein